MVGIISIQAVEIVRIKCEVYLYIYFKLLKIPIKMLIFKN